MAKQKTKNHWVRNGALFALLIVVLFVVQAYVLGSKAIGKKVITVLPLPAAFVNADAILLGDYYQRLDIATKLKGTEYEVSNDQVYAQLIENKVAELLARDKKVTVSSKEIDAEYEYLRMLTGKKDIAANYALSEREFKKQILTPQLLKTKLEIWYATNKKLNPDPYKKLDKVQEGLSSDKDFGSLAAAYSEDAKSAEIGGELGFLSRNDLVPELFTEIEKISDKDAHIIVSRFGIHVIQVLGKDNKGPNDSTRYNVRQIYIKTGDYQSWFEKQKQYYSVLKLLR